MKKLIQIIFVFLCLFAFPETVSAYSSAGSCTVYSETVFVTWTQQDVDGNYHVYASVSPIDSLPDDWSTDPQTSDISIVPSPNVTVPYIYPDLVNGNMLTVWQYFDPTLNIMRVAAAALPNATGLWDSSTVISDVTTETSGFFDEKGSVDQNGNMMVTWTAFDETAGNSIARGVVGTVSEGGIAPMDTFWSASFIISQ